MFLDDELLEILENRVITDAASIAELNQILCTKCETYYKECIKLNMTGKEAKVILDRVFNLWDSFARMAVKKGGTTAILGEFFTQSTFKSQFLANPQVAEVYKNL